VARTRRSLAPYALALAGLVLAGLLLLPADAHAQFPPTPWGNNDQCVDEGPQGRGRGQDSRNNLSLTVVGSGTLTPIMHGTEANCITPLPFGSPPECGTACMYEVQTVCEFHCLHDHTAPFHWPVRVEPQAPAGSYFRRWGSDCAPIKDAARTHCVVRMNTDQSLTGFFEPTPDSTEPSAPVLTVAPGSYSATLSWSPSSDPELAGYEVWKGGVLHARVSRSSTSFQENLFCQTGYSFQVKAYDSINEAPSNSVSFVTGACSGPNTNPKPNTVIHVKPPKSTRSRTAFFHYGQRGNVRATKYQCKLDRKAWTACSGVSGKRYRNLKVGSHTFRVRAGNASGFDSTPATHIWRIRR